jgi:hypothetical protein
METSKKLEFYDAQSCAIQEIHRLKDFKDDPKGAMVSFCRSNLGRPVVWKVVDPTGNDKGANGALFSFYFFSSSIYKGRSSYGEQFASFIVDNRLGNLVTTPALLNKAYHPDHANQIWIWMPDLPALNKWWKENQPKRKVRDKV